MSTSKIEAIAKAVFNAWRKPRQSGLGTVAGNCAFRAATTATRVPSLATRGSSFCGPSNSTVNSYSSTYVVERFLMARETAHSRDKQAGGSRTGAFPNLLAIGP